MWPDHGPTPFAEWRLAAAPKRRRLGIWYMIGAILCTTIALFGGALLWLFWPAVSLLLVALIYFGLGPDAFQKREVLRGIATRWLLAPYIAGAWANSRIWTWRHPQPDEIIDGVWLGRMPSRNDMSAGRFAALLDLTAELPTSRGHWTAENLPWLDLVPPDAEQLRDAANHIESMRNKGPLLVCCALGYSRAASAIAAWLLISGRSASVAEASMMIAIRRPCVVLGSEHRATLDGLLP